MIVEPNFIYNNLQMNKFYKVFPTQFGWHKYEQKSVASPTVRQNYIIHVVLSGKGFFKTRNKKINITKNQTFIIKPSEIVYYYPDPLDPWEYVWIGVDGEDVENILKQLTLYEEDDYVIDLKETENIKKLIFMLIENEKNFDEFSNFSHGILYIFLYELYKNIKFKNEEHIIKSNNIKKIQDYIKKNIKTVSVQSICKEMNMERTGLFKIFKKEFNVSPKTYILQNRLEIARELIVETNIDLKSVCSNSGFGNYSHFCRIFTKYYNASPSEFRKINQ